MVNKREIVTCIILSLITCGIYGLIWFYNITADVAHVSGDNDIQPGTALLLTIITCGIYGIYWNYIMGKKLYKAGQTSGKDTDDNAVLYLILSLFKFDIVSYCFMQTELNKYAD